MYNHVFHSTILKNIITGIFIVLLLGACKNKGTEPNPEFFQLLRVTAGSLTLSPTQNTANISVEPVIEVEFSSSVDTASARYAIKITETDSEIEIPLNFQFVSDDKVVRITARDSLAWNSAYQLEITSGIKGRTGAAFPGTDFVFTTQNGTLLLQEASVNQNNLMTTSRVQDIPFDDAAIEFSFSHELSETDYQSYFSISPSVPARYELSQDRKKVVVTATSPLDYYRRYTVHITSNLKAANGFTFAGFSKDFITGLNPHPKFPIISDEELLDKVQEATFRYFWDFAHPVSGLARERNTSGETVTIGGSGFGLMAILVGIRRGYITREQGVERLGKIVNFLGNADRFHGVWPHWMNGSTGRTQPFSTRDNGADLVETSFMAQGLVTVRQYLDEGHLSERELIDDINTLLDEIEWDWFTRNGQNVLYWHWSPDQEWAMNMQIKGYNEALITYIMAATSASHAIEPQVYHSGWASSGAIRNGRVFYGYELPVGFDYGGPLFFSHYSFLGLDPRGLSDQYADYWVQNRNHTLINRQHNINNPHNYVGYSSESWGLTASDDHTGYGVHEPTRDNGTITPTAALSSMPYTPEESMEALRHFYYTLGDKLWGTYGFYDSFNPTQGWWSSAYLAIDQGPIIIMIENHRSGLLWDLFMEAPEVGTALNRLGFSSSRSQSFDKDINLNNRLPGEKTCQNTLSYYSFHC